MGILFRVGMRGGLVGGDIIRVLWHILRSDGVPRWGFLGICACYDRYEYEEMTLCTIADTNCSLDLRICCTLSMLLSDSVHCIPKSL